MQTKVIEKKNKKIRSLQYENKKIFKEIIEKDSKIIELKMKIEKMRQEYEELERKLMSSTKNTIRGIDAEILAGDFFRNVS